MFINKISASKSDTIDQCLWKYNLKYIERIPGFGSANEESLNFGSYIHKIFELGYRENDSKELLKLAEQQRPNHKIPFSMEDRTKKCIENFVMWNSKMGETVSTEMAFEVPLDKEHDINFNGVIDRIIKGTDGGYLVIDYKTSKKEKKKKDLADDKQLLGYAFAIHTIYGVDIGKIVCAHYYPVTGNFVPVRFSKIQVWNWKRKEIEKVWRIRKKTKNEFPAQKNIFCDWCEYQKVCEKYNSKEEVCKRLEEQFALRDRLAEERKAKKIEEEKKAADDKNPKE